MEGILFVLFIGIPLLIISISMIVKFFNIADDLKSIKVLLKEFLENQKKE
ncbi:MAG: hypothetical protein ACOYOV_15630 [Bacteroidales bacterium]